MKKIDLGQTIAILANLGVIAGLAFLALELQQNNEILDTQMRFNQNERVTEVQEEFFRNPDLRRAFAKYVNDDELNVDEELTLAFYAQRVFSVPRFAWPTGFGIDCTR